MLANDLVMAWAQHRDTGELRYILELGEGERGAKCNCVCISCRQPLTAVNAAKDECQKRPHFRHPEGSQKDSCMVLAARAAIMEALKLEDALLLPRRRRSSRVEGLSGHYHEAWVESPPEQVRISKIDFHDRLKALLTLDDGRELIVHLVGSALPVDDGGVVPSIDIILDDPAIAAMSVDEIRRRLVPLLEGACWRSHWHDVRLAEQAEAAARDKAIEELDWDEFDDLPEDTPAELRRETLLHRVVKAILKQHKRIRLPELLVRADRLVDDGMIGRETVIPATLVHLSTVALERRLGRIVPDVIAKKLDGEELLVEVTVTNRITDERLERIRGEGCAAIEIDISRMGGRVTRAELEKLVIEEVAGKRWLHYPKLDAVQQALQREIDEEIARQEARKQRVHLTSICSASGWAEQYLTSIERHAEYRTYVDKGGEDDGIREYYLEEAKEAAQGLSGHGYPEAEEPELFCRPHNIIERILSIKKDAGVGYDLDSGWKVINAILQEGRPNWKWHTLYLMAIRVYKPKQTNEQAARIDRWRGDVWSSIEAGEFFYLRDTKYDRLLGLLFPKMQELLARPIMRSAGSTSRKQSFPPLAWSPTAAMQHEENLWLRGRRLEEWKRRNPEAAKRWFGDKK